ncbi:twin transmembrane helix small protein [Neptuniibacter sp.]|uniref:twin transmembrane helix small protein n=1 Tax=Neptuniibacter sp. TaxID=1962643 RepID=UPI0026179C86|nr:twin transmembrane helix small protein [Neptuniibacter sp.]MCP4597464.1 twin transmembrane helix small protein [Neptuniibacter sp.]
MSLKLLLVIAFAAVVVSLFSGLFFLIRDQGKTHRTVNSLFFRVAFSALIIVILLYGFYTGELTPHLP